MRGYKIDPLGRSLLVGVGCILFYYYLTNFMQPPKYVSLLVVGYIVLCTGFLFIAKFSNNRSKKKSSI